MKKLFEVIVESTEKIRISCTISAKNAEEAKLNNWKILSEPKEIKNDR